VPNTFIDVLGLLSTIISHFVFFFINFCVTELNLVCQQEWQTLGEGILIEQFMKLFCQPHVYESQMVVATPTWPCGMTLFSALDNAGPCHAHSRVLGTKNLQDTLHELALDV
jgi:hypothetical protein